MTPLFKKLNFKNQAGILAVNTPESFESELAAMAGSATIYKDESDVSAIDFVIVFVTRQNEIDDSIRKIYPKLEGDAVLWYCYPKGTSKKYKCDFNRDHGWDELGKFNLEGVRQVAIDEDWSALRFRKTVYIKTLTRNFAISEEGKKRTGKTGA
ncbi:MAG: hypothetical protein ABS46_00835 [Cytophagaceae bacterium SCN 52-12]|nr:MAG: hypothetical protein ABS46_00835 [Cytophagaceae bacterium SCN 52-12]